MFHFFFSFLLVLLRKTEKIHCHHGSPTVFEPTRRQHKIRMDSPRMRCGTYVRWYSHLKEKKRLIEGYLNSVAGPVHTIFSKIYPEEYPNLPTTPLVPSIVFVGLVFGQLSFGYISDSCGRRVGMVAATIIVILFSALCAGAWHPTLQGMMILFTVFRFCLGVGIGAEYPAGSVAASEATAETAPGRRHGLFIMVTNFVIDFGFVVGNLVPCILVVCLLEMRLTIGHLFRESFESGMANRCRTRMSSASFCVLLPIEDGGTREI